MGRYLVQPDPEVGPGGDVVFRKHPATSPAHDGAWVLYVGEKVFGTIVPQFVHSDTPSSWTAISNGKGNELVALNMMDGFASRWHAAVYIIKHHGYWLAEERAARRRTAEALARAKERTERQLSRTLPRSLGLGTGPLDLSEAIVREQAAAALASIRPCPHPHLEEQTVSPELGERLRTTPLVPAEAPTQVPVNPNPISPASIAEDGSILVVTTDNKLVRYVPDV